MQNFVILLAATTVGVEYGWELRDDGSVNYIIQVEPELLNRLRAGETVTSRIDPRLRNVRSFSIRVGSQQLPKELPQSLLESAKEQPELAVNQLRPAADDPSSEVDRTDLEVTAPSKFPPDVDAQWSESRLRSLEPPPIDDLTEGNDPLAEDTVDPDDNVEDVDETNRMPASGVFADSPTYEGADHPTRALAGRDNLLGDDAQSLLEGWDGSDPFTETTTDGGIDDGDVPKEPAIGISESRDGEYAVTPAIGEYDVDQDATVELDDAKFTSAEDPDHDSVPAEVMKSDSPASTESSQANQSHAAELMEKDRPEVGSGSEPPRRWMPLILTMLALFASLGLNVYLGWIVWDTYNRYQDLLADMQSPESQRAGAG